MSSGDFEELLRQLDPSRAHDIPTPDSVHGQRIKRAALSRGRRGRPQKRGLVAAIAAAVVLFGAAAGAFFVFSDTPTRSVDVVCFASSDLDGVRVAVEFTDSVAVSDCNRLWQDGTFGSDGQPPALAACVLSGGAIAIIPGEESVCGEHGLAIAVDVQTLDPVVALGDELALLAPGGTCAQFDTTLSRIREAVTTPDLPGWTVQVAAEPTTDRPCLSYAIDEELQAVVVLAVPDITGG